MIRRDLPEVVHAANCLCRACCDARRDEAASRRESAIAEEQRGRELAYLEAMSGPVYGRLGMPRPMPGTLRAIARRYGRSA